MSELANFVIAGSVAGSLYAIVASGLVLTFATSGVFNFAQGGIAFVTALLYYELNSGLHWPILPAALVSILVFAPLIGLLLDRVMFRGLAKAGSTAQIVATVGLSVALPALGIFIVERARSLAGVHIPSADNVVTPPGVGPTPASVLHLFARATLDSNQLATLAAAAVTALALWGLVRHTTLGLQMRASVDRRELGALRGVNPARSGAVAWMLSTLLAGLAGVLGAPILALAPTAFTELMLVSAAAAVFARLRSIPVAFGSGLALGVIQDLVGGYISPRISIRGLSSSVPYLLLFVGLLVLLIDRRRRAGGAADESPPGGLLDDQPSLARGLGWAVVVAAVLVYTLLIASDFWVGLIVSGFALGLIFLSFSVVTGIGGMVSLAQATFVAAAGMTTGILVAHHVPFLPALVAGVAVSTIVGILVSLPALRLGGIPLALATLAIAYIGDLLIFQLDGVRNSDLGWNINRPKLGGVNFSSDKSLAVLIIAVVLIVVLLIRNLQRSPSGRAMLALRSSGVAAPAVGISPVAVKLGLFALSAAIAGLGGVLYITYTGNITNASFPAAIGLIWLAVVVTFGVRRPAFAVVAGLVYSLFPQILVHVTTSTVVPQILFGLGGVGLARNPEGVMSDTAKSVAQSWKKLVGSHKPAHPTDAARPIPAGSANGATKEPEADPILTLRGLRAGYGDVEVLHGVDLTIGRGTLTGILGANGAGKSTLCSVLAGALVPSAGVLRYDGEVITDRPAYWRARHGLLLAPEARGIFPGLSVEENLRLVLRTKEEREKAYARFPLLAQRRRSPAGVLSGGEQQMLTLAPLLVRPPRLLVADEPSLGLAPLVVERLFQVFTELRSRGVTLVVVEEKVRDVLPVADRVVLLELGRVAWQGVADEGDTGRLAATYLGLERSGHE